jgi:hypothetical protein
LFAPNFPCNQRVRESHITFGAGKNVLSIHETLIALQLEAGPVEEIGSAPFNLRTAVKNIEALRGSHTLGKESEQYRCSWPRAKQMFHEPTNIHYVRATVTSWADGAGTSTWRNMQGPQMLGQNDCHFAGSKTDGANTMSVFHRGNIFK